MAVTNDGGIFVTGIITSSTAGETPFTKGEADCFILRLNYTLERVYAKSFGVGSTWMGCYSIQVTRNYDYIYLGGVRKSSSTASSSQLFFAKTDTYVDTLIATQLTPDSSDLLTLSRIIL